MWPFTISSPDAAVERELRVRLLEKGVNSDKLRGILETDRQVALRAVRTGRAADARDRTLKNMTQIKKEEKRLETADDSIKDLLSGESDK